MAIQNGVMMSQKGKVPNLLKDQQTVYPNLYPESMEMEESSERMITAGLKQAIKNPAQFKKDMWKNI